MERTFWNYEPNFVPLGVAWVEILSRNQGQKRTVWTGIADLWVVARSVHRRVASAPRVRVFGGEEFTNPARELSVRGDPMAYVVAEPCINCKFTDCVDVTQWIASTRARTSRDSPRTALTAVHATRVSRRAIYEEDELPEEWNHYIE